MQPTVSVVVPCYNGARYLGEAIESVIRQTLPPKEIVVVDDGSTDDSAAVALAFGNRVRVLKQSNAGESAARNRGIEVATGDVVAFLDADDTWMPRKNELQVAAFERGSRAVASGMIRGTTANGPDAMTLLPATHDVRPEYLIVHGFVAHISSLMVARDLPVRFPEWTQSGEDLIYCLDLLSHTSITMVPEPLVFYRQHSAAQTATTPGMLFRYHDALVQWVDQHPTERSQFRPWLTARLRHQAEMAYWRRDWALHDAICEFASTHYPDEATAFRRRRFPRWTYALRDRFSVKRSN